jgi:5-(carboxyamino)imidazole ribonucleotide mutase
MNRTKVGILMGSESDLDTMQKAAKVLEEMDVPYDMRILSAHRLPDLTADYARGARERGLEVIICGAGMAAHLAGKGCGRYGKEINDRPHELKYVILDGY